MQALKEQEIQLKPRAAHTMVSSNTKGYSCFIGSRPLKDEGVRWMQVEKKARRNEWLRAGLGAEEGGSREHFLPMQNKPLALTSSGPRKVRPHQQVTRTQSGIDSRHSCPCCELLH